jgi:3-hydroxyisobutyrate dehydrogenase-like beta-hydroxyacid dehydrogenase
MGSGIVKNLLNSGHSVIVWNRSPDKVRPTVVSVAVLPSQKGASQWLDLGRHLGVM